MSRENRDGVVWVGRGGAPKWEMKELDVRKLTEKTEDRGVKWGGEGRVAWRNELWL